MVDTRRQVLTRTNLACVLQASSLEQGRSLMLLSFPNFHPTVFFAAAQPVHQQHGVWQYIADHHCRCQRWEHP